MKNLQLLIVAGIVAGFADVAASDKDARIDQFERKSGGKGKDIAKEARRYPSDRTTTPVIVSTKKPKASNNGSF